MNNKFAFFTPVAMLVYTFFLLLYNIMLVSDDKLYSIAGFFLFVCSILLIEIALYDIKKYKFNAFNLFVLIFFSSLLLNTLTLSNVQSEKNWIDVYYFLYVPMITSLFLYYVEHKKIIYMNVKMPKFDANKLAIFLLMFFIILKSYIYLKTGIRLIDFNNGKFFLEEETYVVPTITGLSNVVQWLLVVSLLYVSNKLRVLIILFIVSVAILNVKRGDIIREVLYIILMYIYINRDRFNRAFFRKIILSFLGLVFVFTFLGELRQETRSQDFNINTQIQGKIDNTGFNWMYGYIALNFDVAKEYIKDDREKLMYPFVVLQPVNNLIGFKQEILEYYDNTWNYRIYGFNAAPYFSLFIHDMGMLYFIEGIIYSVVLALLILLTKKMKSDGTYIFLLMLLSFSFFGPYLFEPQMFYTIFFGVVYTSFIKQKRKF